MITTSGAPLICNHKIKNLAGSVGHGRSKQRNGLPEIEQPIITGLFFACNRSLLRDLDLAILLTAPTRLAATLHLFHHLGHRDSIRGHNEQ